MGNLTKAQLENRRAKKVARKAAQLEKQRADEAPINMDLELWRAKRDMARSTQAINAGETYRSGRRNAGPERSPSRNRDGYHS